MIAHMSNWRGIALVTVAILLVALPLLVTSSFATDIFIRILLFAFIGVAWNLMGGYAKQLSLGHAAYFGLGAYTSTILEIRFGISDRKSTRLNSSHANISYAVFCLKKKNKNNK